MTPDSWLVADCDLVLPLLDGRTREPVDCDGAGDDVYRETVEALRFVAGADFEDHADRVYVAGHRPPTGDCDGAP